jgi:hypothetical protein
METPDQGRQHMRAKRIVVVARTVEVGGHGGDEVAAVLAPVGLAELDAGNLGDGVPLVGRLEGAAQQELLLQRLGGHPRVDAGAAEEQQLAHPMPPGRIDDVVLDGQVAEEELAREVVVGLDAADLGRRKEHRLGPLGREERVDGTGIAEVQLAGAPADEVPVSAPLQAAPDGAAGQAMVSRDVDLGVLGEGHRGHRPGPECPETSRCVRRTCPRPRLMGNDSIIIGHREVDVGRRHALLAPWSRRTPAIPSAA